MEFWVALGIEQTKDEEAINAAYREKLQLVHPEEHPEEFMQLRAAYDEALKYARQSEDGQDEAPKGPIDLWLMRVEEVYNNLQRRISVDEWKKLLSDEVCQGIDSRLDARDALLKFCMECFYLPNEVWQVIIDAFAIRENYDELCEKFPKSYIDNAVIGGADWPTTVPYELYGKEYTGNPDAFIKLYFKTRDERRERNYEAAAATIADMRALGVDHPFDRYAEVELAQAMGDKEKANEIADQLFEQYPDCCAIRGMHGDICRLNREDYEAALADYNFVLEKYSDRISACFGKAECLLAMDQLEDAKDIYLNLHQQMPYDSDISGRIESINKQLGERYEQQIAEQPDNIELRMDYAWSCLQERNYDKTRELLAGVKPSNDAELADLKNISTKFCLNCEEFEQALAHATEWEQITYRLPEGETDEEKRRKGKTAEAIRLQATALYALKRYDEALERLDAAEKLDSDMQEIYNLRRHIHRRRRDFDKAVQDAEKLVKLEPNYMNWFALGYEQFEQGDKAAAYHSFGEALDYAKVLQAFIYRARILCWFDEWDSLKEAIEFLEQGGVDADNSGLRFLKARLLHHDDQKQEALDIYNSLIAEYEKEEAEGSSLGDHDFIHEVYHLAADIEDDFDTPANKVMVKVEKGLSLKEDYYPLLDLKNYLLHNKFGDRNAIIEHNRKILELYPKNNVAHQRIGDALYYLDRYEEAVEEFLIQEQVRDSGWTQEVLGICLMYLERYDEAEAHFRKAVEVEPERLRAKANLGLMYERRWNPEKNAYDFDLSLPLLEECLRINEEQEEDRRSRGFRLWLARCLSRMNRHKEAAEHYRISFERYGEEEDARHQVEVLMEGGFFAEGEKLLDKYHAEGVLGDDPYYIIKADFRLYQGKEREFVKYINKTPECDRKYGRIADHYVDHSSRKMRRYALECYDKAFAMNPDRGYGFSNYIRLLREFDRTGKAQLMAQKAFAQLEAQKNQGWDYSLYLTKMAFTHIVLGNADLAKPFIDKAMTGPLCDHCRYSRCKDAYIALAEYYLEKGMYEESAKVCREALEFCRDDEAFPSILKRLKKERKIK